MEEVAVILIDGVIYASWLFVVAVGLTLIFGVMRIVNIAHGAVYAIGAYATATLVGLGLQGSAPPWVSLVLMVIAAASVAAIVGPLIERGVLRWFYGRDEMVLLLVTYAILYILDSLMLSLWGSTPYYVTEAYGVFDTVRIGRLSYVGYDFLLIAVALAVGFSLHVYLSYTSRGKLLTAVIHSAELSSAMGVNVNRIYVWTFTLGVFLAALAGALTSPMISIQPGVGTNLIIVSFAVIIIGGLGSIYGAAVGALIVGICRSAAIHTLPETELFVIYVVMVVVLLVRPEGLFAPMKVRRI